MDETLMIEPPPAAFIALTHGLHAQEGARQVDVDHLLPLGHIELADLAERDDPGVVHQHIEQAELRGGGFDRGVPLVFLGDIEVYIADRISEFGCQRLALVVEDVPDHHLGAFGDQRAGVLRAHTARAAADECHFSVYPSHDG